MKISRHLAIAALAVVVAAAAALAWKSLSHKEMAPDVAFTPLEGAASSIGNYKGKVLLVNFWATSCTSCIKEMPDITATHLRFKDRGFDTLAVAMSYDQPELVARFTRSRQLPFTVAHDATEQVAKQFGNIQLTPTTVLIDQQGRIVKRYVGVPDFTALNALIDKLLTKA